MTRLVFDGAVLEIASKGGAYSITYDGTSHPAEVINASNDRFELLVDGQHLVAQVSAQGRDRWVTVNGRTFHFSKSSGAARSSTSHAGSSDLTAPMPGQVRAVNIQAGDTVSKGQVLIVLEAMKMEIRLQAPYDATILSLDARLDQTVEREQVLVRLSRL